MAGEDGTRDAAGAPEPPGPSGPAPIIDLGGDAVPVRPVKPLGPRRLARLQRELAERARELEQSGGEPADPDLLEKQRRFAELAAAAEADNAASAARTGVTEPVTALPAGPAPAPAEQAPARPGPAEGAPAEPVEQITVVFPGADGPVGTDGHVGHDPVHVDPSLFSNRLAPEELAALTHIEILAPDEHHGSHAAAPEGPGAAAGAPADPREPGGTAAPPEPPGTGEPPGPGDTVGPPGAVDGAGPPEPAGPWPAAEEEPEPPAAPVPATAAGGLELLEPREYRRRAGSPWLVLLLPALLATLAVVLVLFVL